MSTNFLLIKHAIKSAKQIYNSNASSEAKYHLLYELELDKLAKKITPSLSIFSVDGGYEDEVCSFMRYVADVEDALGELLEE